MLSPLLQIRLRLWFKMFSLFCKFNIHPQMVSDVLVQKLQLGFLEMVRGGLRGLRLIVVLL